MQAPDWYGRPKGSLPPPPNIFAPTQSHADDTQKLTKAPPPPAGPPTVPKGTVPPALQTTLVRPLAAQALGLPGPLPPLALLPPAPRTGQIEGTASKAARQYENAVVAASTKKGGAGVSLTAEQIYGRAKANQGQFAINLKDDVLTVAGSKVSAAKGARDTGVAEKAFMIPGLQARPYDDEELVVPFSMIDLDNHHIISIKDLRRTFELCGEPEPTEAELLEMVRLCDLDGNGVVSFDEFLQMFKDPPPLWRNFDLHRREAGNVDFADAEEDEDMDEAAKAKLTARRQSSTGIVAPPGTETPAEPPFDARPEAVATIGSGKKSLRPEFIKQVYQRFVEIDQEDDGYVSYQAFCIVLRKVEGPEVRKAFDIFDSDGMGELDLRHFIVGLSMFTTSNIQEKLRFAFMMYDEDQEEEIGRQDVLELIKAIAPHVVEADRERHVNRMYAMHDLGPQMRVTLEEFTKYMMERAPDLVPAPPSNASQAADHSSRTSDRTSNRTSNQTSRQTSHVASRRSTSRSRNPSRSW